jgi:hypothetical protein
MHLFIPALAWSDCSAQRQARGRFPAQATRRARRFLRSRRAFSRASPRYLPSSEPRLRQAQAARGIRCGLSADPVVTQRGGEGGVASLPLGARTIERSPEYSARSRRQRRGRVTGKTFRAVNQSWMKPLDDFDTTWLVAPQLQLTSVACSVSSFEIFYPGEACFTQSAVACPKDKPRSAQRRARQGELFRGEFIQ